MAWLTCVTQDKLPDASLLCISEGFRGGRSSGVGIAPPVVGPGGRNLPTTYYKRGPMKWTIQPYMTKTYKGRKYVSAYLIISVFRLLDWSFIKVASSGKPLLNLHRPVWLNKSFRNSVNQSQSSHVTSDQSLNISMCLYFRLVYQSYQGSKWVSTKRSVIV